MKMRFIPTSVHGAVDHVVGPALVLAPTLLRLGRMSPEGLKKLANTALKARVVQDVAKVARAIV